MNNLVMMGRLTKPAEVRYTSGENPMAIASFSIAVDRRFKRQGQPEADFFNCIAFRKTAEFIEKYLSKGSKVVIQGELQNNNWTDRDGKKHYSDHIIVNQIEFAESKKSQSNEGQSGVASQQEPDENGFMNLPDTISEELPFN